MVSSDLNEARQDMERVVSERDSRIAWLEQTISKRDKIICARDELITALNQKVAEQGRQIAELGQAVATGGAEIAGLKEIDTRQNKELVGLRQLLARVFFENVRLNQSLAASRLHLADIEQSRSWKFTRPYRVFGDTVKAALNSIPGLPFLPSGSSRTPSTSFVASGGQNRRETDATNQSVKQDDSRRILVADYRIPRADVSAGERATVGILKDLCALGYEVVLLPNDMEPFPRYEAELRALGVNVVTRDAGYVSSRDYVEANGYQFGTLYVIRVEVAESILPLFREVAPMARIIFHAPDLYHLRELREAELHDDSAMRDRALASKERELAMMRLAGHVVVVSPAEVPILQAELPEVPITVFPVLYAPILPVDRGFNDRRHLFFIGGFGHPPNVDAVQWFAREVWPIVREALPDVEFHILGAEAPPSVVALGAVPGIRVVGFVQNLDPLLGMFRLGVAPLRYGAGIKGKVATTMGAGVPCVCTEIAAEGMGIEHGMHALVADEPQKFAEEIVSLYNDAEEWERLSRQGQTLVRKCFSEEANRTALIKVLDRARALPLPLFLEYCRDSSPKPFHSPGEDELVDVSIILAVKNRWELTQACLTSLLETTLGSDVRYEVILADDGSADDTVRAGDIFTGLEVVRSESTLGFCRTCNKAAKQARGRYILLLTNDMVVLPGWLETLNKTIEEDPSAGIVGGKLLYPDGQVKEAGGGILSNGECMDIGQCLRVGEERFVACRDEAVLNLLRETDCILDAPCIIRRSLWETAGGLDDSYQTSRWGRADLAMSARAHSYRVIYQPGSEAVLNQECGVDTESGVAPSAGIRTHDVRLFRQKWDDALRIEHLPAGSRWHLVAANGERTVPPAVESRRKSGSLNILYFSPFPSHPCSHGNQSTIQQFGKRFQTLGHKVHFAILESSMFTEEDQNAMRGAWDTFEIIPNKCKLWADGKPIQFDGWYEEGVGEYVRFLCEKHQIDIVFCSYVFQSKLLEFVPGYILKVIDTHDKMGGRYEMLRRNGQPLEFFSCTPEEEGAYLRRADLVVARREEEARYFDDVSGRATAIVIPHVENAHFIERKFELLAHVGMVASANQINLAIVCEFLEVLGRRLDSVPWPFTVHVAGEVKRMVSSLPPEKALVFNHPCVQLHGFVQDISEFYGKMDVVVSPVTMGTGINVKTVQAMAYGMPLLATAWGTKGISTNNPMHNHPDIEALVESLLEISKNPERLAELAVSSRDRYSEFLAASLRGFKHILHHQKVLPSIRSSQSIKDNMKQQKRMECPDSSTLPLGGVEAHETMLDRIKIRREDLRLPKYLAAVAAAYYEEGRRDEAVVIRDISYVKSTVKRSFVPDMLRREDPHDPDFTIFRAFSDPNALILDIGANWGYSASSFWAVGARSKIVSFEPLPWYDDILDAIAELKGERYAYVITALSNIKGRLKLVVPVINGIAITGFSSAASHPHLPSYVKNLEHWVNAYLPSEEQSIDFRFFELDVPTDTLDNVVEEKQAIFLDRRVDAIKVDVEGLELEVLKGAKSTLRLHSPLVMAEGGNRTPGLASYMESLGYRYAEREGDRIRLVQGIGRAVNGFFCHQKNMPRYQDMDILAM